MLLGHQAKGVSFLSSLSIFIIILIFTKSRVYIQLPKPYNEKSHTHTHTHTHTHIYYLTFFQWLFWESIGDEVSVRYFWISWPSAMKKWHFNSALSLFSTFSILNEVLNDRIKVKEGFLGGSDSKESAWNAGDLGSIPGSGRTPGEGHGNPLHYSCLENPMDRGAWKAAVRGVTKNRTQLKQLNSSNINAKRRYDRIRIFNIEK